MRLKCAKCSLAAYEKMVNATPSAEGIRLSSAASSHAGKRRSPLALTAALGVLALGCSARTELMTIGTVGESDGGDRYESGEDSAIDSNCVNCDPRCPAGGNGISPGVRCELEGARCGVTCGERDGGWPSYAFVAICHGNEWSVTYRQCQ